MRNNDLLLGVTEETNEDSRVVIQNILESKNISIDVNSIDKCHRLGITRVGQCRPLIIRFCRVHDKESLIRQMVDFNMRTKNDDRITVREHLTPARLVLF